MTRKAHGVKARRRGIYILPNIFTSLNLFFGFYALISAIRERYETAAVLIIIAAVCDILDGKIARATRTTSKFGMEYDSLADLVSFGLAPSLMMFLWALQPVGRIGWLAAFLFTICGALRLARFNVQSGSASGDHFTGLPIPAAAGMNATIVLLWDRLGMEASPNSVVILFVLYALSFLMVSSIPYNSFKKAELFRKMNFNALVAAVLILMFIAAQPSVALFLMGTVYVISGPFAAWRHWKAADSENFSASETDENHSETV